MITNRRFAMILLTTCTVATLAGGCGAGGGSSIPKALLGHHASDSSEASVSISPSDDHGDDDEPVASEETRLTVESTRFYSSRGRANALAQLLNDDAPRITIQDPDLLKDLTLVGGEITIEREGFLPEAGHDGRVIVLVELNRGANRMPMETMVPQAHVSVSRIDGTESVSLSFGAVSDPTAESTQSLLHDAHRITILQP